MSQVDKDLKIREIAQLKLEKEEMLNLIHDAHETYRDKIEKLKTEQQAVVAFVLF